MTVIGKRLRRLLAEKQMTQRELARRFGWGDTTVSNYLSGNREPDLDTVQILADYFSVTIDYLLGRTNNRKGDVEPDLPDNWEEIIRDLSGQGLTPEDVKNAIDLIHAYKKMRQG